MTVPVTQYALAHRAIAASVGVRWERTGRRSFGGLERTSVHEVRDSGGSALWRKCHKHRRDQGNARKLREKEGEDNMRSDSWGDVRGNISWAFLKNPCTQLKKTRHAELGSQEGKSRSNRESFRIVVPSWVAAGKARQVFLPVLRNGGVSLFPINNIRKDFSRSVGNISGEHFREGTAANSADIVSRGGSIA